MKHNTDSYWTLVKAKKQQPVTTLLELGTIAEHHKTEIAHSLMLAVIVAKYHGSEYGWK